MYKRIYNELEERWYNFCEESGMWMSHNKTNQWWTWNLLVSLYNCPKNRYYHTLNHHIYYMFESYDALKEYLRSYLTVNDKRLLEFAIWFHDIFYDTTTKCSNELASANLAMQIGEMFSIDSESVFELILATEPERSFEIKGGGLLIAKIMLDIDLAMFSSPLDYFFESLRKIRAEYFCSDEDFLRGRKAFLQRFVDRGFVYWTEPFKGGDEHIAMERIKADLEGQHDDFYTGERNFLGKIKLDFEN